VIVVLEPFLSFMFFFQPSKVHNMLALMLDPHYKGLGLVIRYVGKQRVFHVIDKYDKEVLFLLFLCAYKILNLNNANEKGPCSSTSQIFQSTSL